MRKQLEAFLVVVSIFANLLVLISCDSKKEIAPVIPTKTAVITDKGVIYFKAEPLSDSEVKMSFLLQNSRTLEKLILTDGTTALQSFEVRATEGVNYLYTASVKYSFISGANYRMLLQTNNLSDTVYQYAVNNYQHIYKRTFSLNKIANINSFIGFDAYSVSPSRNFVFFTDYPNVNRLNLLTGEIVPLGASVNSLTLRAASDNEILTLEHEYNGAYLKGDTIALMKYDMNTKQSQLVDWVDAMYPRVSNVVNNHILVANHVFKNKGSLINLTDNSKVLYDTMQDSYIQTWNYDNLYYNNHVMDVGTGSAIPQLSLANDMTHSSNVLYTDNGTGIKIIQDYVRDLAATQDPDFYLTRLRVFQQNNLIYQNDFERGRFITVAKVMNIQNNKMIVFQTFSFSTLTRLDGYYLLDLNQGSLTLLDTYGSPNRYAFDDFQLSATETISLKPDGVYRLTR